MPQSPVSTTTNLARYQRIAPVYDLLDLPFERRRYQALRPLMFQNLGGRLLDAGIGTGRNCAFYPPNAIVSGIDTSPAMLERAHRRCPTLAAGGRLYQMDVTHLEFPTGSFDAAVSTFLFCVLPNDLQVPALRELGRVVKPGGLIRLLEYVRPRGTFRRSGSRSATGGLIRYKRGNVTMIDRAGLEQRSCECYRVSKREFDRLLGAD
jgi:ubiquinone/menaquinone biosynthesis C-methylase UbiE